MYTPFGLIPDKIAPERSFDFFVFHWNITVESLCRRFTFYIFPLTLIGLFL